MPYECECGSDPPLLPLREPWYPGNGYDEKAPGANVWCAACCEAWKVAPAVLTRVTHQAEAFDREEANTAEAIATRAQLEVWEQWCAENAPKERI